MVEYITDAYKKQQIARDILNQLPEWFGLPDSTNEYVENSTHMPFWAYYEKDKPVGFIVLKETSKATAEIYVMGVLKACQHQGVGKQLWNVFLQYARAQSYEYVQVKTVKKGHYKAYDSTNCFYEELGFKELECFPTLWDAWNPCQVYVKYIVVAETIV